jgi:hypothetical protein
MKSEEAMRQPQRTKKFTGRMFQSLVLPHAVRDIDNRVAVIVRLAVTASAFAFCGWIAAGDVGAAFFGTAAFALLTHNRSRNRDSTFA